MTDLLQKKFFFNHSIEVIIPHRQEWVGEGPCFEDNFMLWFTDSSRKDSKVGKRVRFRLEFSIMFGGPGTSE